MKSDAEESVKRVSFLLLICFVVLSWFYGGALLEHQLAVWSVLSLSLLISAALFKASAMDFLFLGIGFWVVLSGMASEVPHDTQRAVFRLGIPLLAYVAARWSLSEEKDYRELLEGCVAVGACLSLYGWGQTAGFFDASFWADPSYPAAMSTAAASVSCIGAECGILR